MYADQNEALKLVTPDIAVFTQITVVRIEWRPLIGILVIIVVIIFTNSKVRW
jgi:hypothetical protein